MAKRCSSVFVHAVATSQRTAAFLVRRSPMRHNAGVEFKDRRVVVVGLFSARVKHPLGELSAVSAQIAAAGGTIVGELMQRRGVSRSTRPGGGQAMGRPLSPSTLIGAGKVAELAALCAATRADVVVFYNPLTDAWRERLAALTDCTVVDARAIQREIP